MVASMVNLRHATKMTCSRAELLSHRVGCIIGIILFLLCAALAAEPRSRGWCQPNSWICGPDGAAQGTSTARAFHEAVSVQHRLYLFGGRLGHTQNADYAPFVQESEVFQYIDEQTWSLQTVHPADGCTVPSARSHFVLLPWRERFLIMFGGQIPSDGTQRSFLASNGVWVYDTMRSLWAEVCQDTIERSACVTTPQLMHNGSTAACVDFGTSMPAPRHSAAGVIFNDSLIIHGGQLRSGHLLSDMWVLDLQPVLQSFQADSVTCRTVPFFMSRVRACSWQAKSMRSSSEHMMGHALAHVQGDVDVLLACGGTSLATTPSSSALDRASWNLTGIEPLSYRPVITSAFDMQRDEWVPVQQTHPATDWLFRQCKFSHTEHGMHLMVYTVKNPDLCNATQGTSATWPAAEWFRILNVSIADRTVHAELQSSFASQWHPSQNNNDWTSATTDCQHGRPCPCNCSLSKSNRSSIQLSLAIASTHEGTAHTPTDTDQIRQTANSPSCQWQLPLLRHFAAAVTGKSELFIDGGITCMSDASNCDCASAPSTGSYLLGLSTLWVKVLRGGVEAYEWVQRIVWPEESPKPVVPSNALMPLDVDYQSGSAMLLLDDQLDAEVVELKHQSFVAFVGKPVDPSSLTLKRWWTCLALRLDTNRTDSGARPLYTSGNTLRFIEELPSTVSDVSISSAWFSPSSAVPLSSANVETCAQPSVAKACLSRQRTHACAPLEPFYGSSLLSIPGHSAFLSFGGRAAVESIEDIPACSRRLARRAWRFQYHPQLTNPVDLDVNGSVIAFHCLNEPVIASVQTTRLWEEQDSNDHSWLKASAFDPTAGISIHGGRVTWARLVPWGLSEAFLQQLLQRSHQAMVHIETDGRLSPQLYLLWGGYGEHMSALNDMWAVYIYSPGTCTLLQSTADSWWVNAWCFTAFPIVQVGTVPAGRAYAKMAVLQNREEVLLHGGCQVCSGDSGIKDPSGSDDLSIHVLDVSPLLALSQPGGTTVTWFLRPMLGTPLMPARKGHGLITSGCSSRVKPSPESDPGGMYACSVLWFGGWNPRWPNANSGHTAVQKLDAELWAWSMIPHEDMTDLFQEAAARTEPSALCVIGRSHFLVMAPYLRSPLLAPLPIEHVAHVQRLPWMLPRAYPGDRISLKPGVLELQGTIEIDVPWIVLTSDHESALMSPDRSLTSASASRNTGTSVPLYAQAPDAASAAFVFDEKDKFWGWTKSPSSCRKRRPVWSVGGPDVVLSCVKMRKVLGRPVQAEPSLGSALNITAAGIVLSGLTVFGCINTALEIWTAGNHMHETTFERNSGQTGGAVMLAPGSTCSFSSCHFMDNTAAIGSAIAMRPGSKVDWISSCSFDGNWQQSEMQDQLTGRMIDPSRAYNDETLELFASRYDAAVLVKATHGLWSVP
eukprot:jgi/Ulvmu1/5232/UM022_0025.1